MAPIPSAFTFQISRLARLAPGGKVVRLVGAPPTLAGGYQAVRGLFGFDEVAALGLAVPPLVSDQCDSSETIDRVTSLELANYLANQLLPDVDSVSMAHSLEVRVPLLDEPVVAAALALPPDVRRDGKALLATAGRLPHRRVKRPFTMPFAAWMGGTLRSTVAEALLSRSLPFDDLLPVTFRARVWRSFESGRTHWSRPWSLVALRLWGAQNGFL